VAREVWAAIRETVERTRQRSGWSVGRVLEHLGISRSTYYAFEKRGAETAAGGPIREPHAVLPEERERVIAYALEHPDLRHRELAWRMVDEDVAYLSPSTVYRILLSRDLVHRWERLPARSKRIREKPTQPDEKWQSDLRYVRVGTRWYYLITFADECSRYIAYWELLRWMDGTSVALAAQAAIDRLPEHVRPLIQTDNGSGYISRDFKLVLSEQGLGHQKIHPHCPEENGLIERINRTLGEKIEEHDFEEVVEAQGVIGGIVRWYNEERLHSAIHFLRPIDVYRGDPEKLLEERRVKLRVARHQRREQNLRQRQTSLYLEHDDRGGNRNLNPTANCPG
jgi:putative transposase